MRAKEFLTEANNLSTSELRAVRGGQPRYMKFLHNVKKGVAFTTSDGKPFVVDPKQYNDLEAFFSDPSNRGTVWLRDRATGELKRNSDLRKTSDFGGQQPSFDQEEPAGKEALPAKPSQVFQTTDVEKLDTNAAKAVKQVLDAGAFYAGQLFDKISTSSTLTGAGEFGQIVINAAKQINDGVMPTLKGVNPTYAKAIRDYAGEYLGVLAVTKGLADFPNQDKFYEFLGTDNLNDLIVYFPKATNNPLADSIAVQNKKSKHIINISSKGGKKGAPPSLDNLKVPNEFRTNPEFEQVIGFFDTAHGSSAKGQPFELMNYLYSIGAKPGVHIPKEYAGILPFSEQDISLLIQLMDKRNIDATVPRKFAKLFRKFDSEESGATPGGIIHYVVNKDMMQAVNTANIIPNFRELVLEILGYNFVQLFSDFKGKDKMLSVRVLWPAKIDGQVEVYSKSYAGEPGKGKLSFSIT